MSRTSTSAPFNQPLSGLVTPRFAGIATFMRLPHVPLAQAKDIEIGIIGVPFDGGTTNRPGPRHAPRQIRDMSQMIRRVNPALGICPYDLANIADLGDADVNPADLKELDRPHRRLLRKSGGTGHTTAVGGRGPPRVLPDPPGAGAAEAFGHGAFRRPHGSFRRLFRRLQDHPWHAFQEGDRRRRARSCTDGPDRNSRFHVRLRGSRICRESRRSDHRD